MDVLALFTLAKHGCSERMLEISSSQLAQELDISQQTASRRIKEFLEEGYIVREILPRGQRIKLTPKGLEFLREMHLELNKIFEGMESFIYPITGEVTSGMGEGRYYMEIPGYREQFTEKLGFAPYHGTMNLRLVTQEDVKVRQTLQGLKGIEIKGFVRDKRTFGSVKCFKASIEGIEGAVIIPSRTHHDFNTIEVIAPDKIRALVGLNDGDLVTIKISV